MTTTLSLLLGAAIIAMIWLNIVNNNLRKRNERLFQTSENLTAVLNEQQNDILNLEHEIWTKAENAEMSFPLRSWATYNITSPIYANIKKILSNVSTLENKVRTDKTTQALLKASIKSLEKQLAEYEEKEKRLRKLTECEKATIEDAIRNNKALEIAIRHAVELAKQGENMATQLDNNEN